MKGILYGNFLLNRKWFLAAGITAILGTAVCLILRISLGVDPEILGTISAIFAGSQFIVLALCEEWLARNLEANIKCRFTDYTLAGGISKNTFVASELMKNVITITIGFAMCMAMQLVMFAADRSFMTSGSIKLALSGALLIGAVDWVINPLVIYLKSAEKAGMIVGFVLGFGIIMPIMILFVWDGEDNGRATMEKILYWSAQQWFMPAIIGICAAIYAIWYFILLKRVKKGDVC